MTEPTFWLKPAKSADGKELRIRDPISGRLCPQEAAEYPSTGVAGNYYRRRKRDGDMVEVDPPAEAEPPKSTHARRSAISGGE